MSTTHAARRSMMPHATKKRPHPAGRGRFRFHAMPGARPDAFTSDQWWNRRMPVNAMAIPYLFAVSITLSSRIEPPGSTM